MNTNLSRPPKSVAFPAQTCRCHLPRLSGAALLLLLLAGGSHLLAQAGHPAGPTSTGLGAPGSSARPDGTLPRPEGNAPAKGGAPRPAAATGLSPTARLAGPAGRWWDNTRYAHSVGLTAEQQRRMDLVFQQNRSALVSGLDNLRKAQSRLEAVTAAGNPSEAAVLTEIQNVAQARADLDKTYTHMTLQIRHEMTDDQLKELEKLK